MLYFNAYRSIGSLLFHAGMAEDRGVRCRFHFSSYTLGPTTAEVLVLQPIPRLQFSQHQRRIAAVSEWEFRELISFVCVIVY